MPEPKKTFGGRQDGAGRPALPEDEKKARIVAYLSPKNYARLIGSAGNVRGALSRELNRILASYYSEPTDWRR